MSHQLPEPHDIDDRVEVPGMDDYTRRVQIALDSDAELDRIERVEQIKMWLLLGFTDTRIVLTGLRKAQWMVSADQIKNDITVARFEIEQQAQVDQRQMKAMVIQRYQRIYALGVGVGGDLRAAAQANKEIAELYGIKADNKGDTPERPFADLSDNELNELIPELLAQTGIGVSVRRETVQREQFSLNILRRSGPTPGSMAERVLDQRPQEAATALLPAEREVNGVGDQGIENGDSETEDNGLAAVADVTPIGRIVQES